ncbi:MAG: ABC transporter substrate-binding protein [Proteobacteria bacterium]|nr:ABC transporter substrate-binding protein [Pseudomonadota bacterium]
MRAITAALAGIAALAAIGLHGAGAQELTPRHAIAMHGEPKYGPDFKYFDYVNPNAPKGGEVKLSAIGTFDNLNPYILKGVAAVGLGGLFETLLTNSDDEAFTEYGQLAESIEMPEDRSWVAFTLRKEARWHDGKPVTPEDVIFSLEILKTKGQPFFRFYFADVKKAEKTGPRTVKFTFSGGENRELPLIVGQMPVLPRHFWEGRQFEKTILEPPLGSGPYRIKAFEPGRSITYERVKDYWGAGLPVNKGRYNFDIIRYDYYRDTTVALEAFKGGEYHFRQENVSKDWATAYNSPAVRMGLIKKEEIRHQRPTGMQGFIFNTRMPLFRDPRVRRALAFAFDFEWTNKNLFYGQYTRTKSYFSNSELASTGLPGPDELEFLEPLRGQIPDEVFTKAYEPPAADGSGNIRGNLRKALRLLKEAGWVIEEGKLVNAGTGAPFAFEILLNQPTWERIALPFRRNLKRLGIDARVRTVDTAQYQRRTEDFDFDMIVDVFGQSLSPGNEQRDMWGSEAAGRPGSRNTIGIRSDAIDTLIDLVIAAPDRESLTARTRALDRVLLWGHYVIPHWHIQSFRVAYWDKFGRPAVTPKYNLGFDTWWIDSGKNVALVERRKNL